MVSVSNGMDFCINHRNTYMYVPLGLTVTNPHFAHTVYLCISYCCYSNDHHFPVRNLPVSVSNGIFSVKNETNSCT
jgi:hypothetical protein